MTPEHTLLLSCLGLGLGVAYAWWLVVRPTILQADLQAVRARLDEAVRARGADAVVDPDYLVIRAAIGEMIERMGEPWPCRAERRMAKRLMRDVEGWLDGANAGHGRPARMRATTTTKRRPP